MDLLDVFSTSELSIAAFFEIRHITPSSFHYWKKKYPGDADSNNAKGGFSALQINAVAGALYAQVGSIKIYQPVSAAYVRELLS